jgi:hypothetical protein
MPGTRQELTLSSSTWTSCGVKDRRYKLIHYPRHAWEQILARAGGGRSGTAGTLARYPQKSRGFVLTDLQRDPLEYRNLSGQAETAGVETELRDRLCSWLLETPRYLPPKPFRW